MSIEDVRSLDFYIFLGINDPAMEQIRQTEMLEPEVIIMLRTAVNFEDLVIFKSILEISRTDCLSNTAWEGLVPTGARSREPKILRLVLQKRGHFPKEAAQAALDAALQDAWSII